MDTPTPTSKIEIAGKEYTLTFDFNAMAIIQEETGRNPFREDFWHDIGPLELLTMIYGMLNTHHPEVNKQSLRANLDMRQFEYYMGQVEEAAKKGMPEAKGEEKKMES
jgi:hypothetical protein